MFTKLTNRIYKTAHVLYGEVFESEAPYYNVQLKQTINKLKLLRVQYTEP